MRLTTIKRNGEFTRAYRRGKSYVHPLLVTYVFPRRKGEVRIGITASRKTGGAVQRNRARRVIRAALAEVLTGREAAVDLVLVARVQTAAQKSGAIAKVLQKQLRAAGVLPEAPPAAIAPPREAAPHA